MSEKEKKIVQSLAQSIKVLPDDKREFLRGYAEGVAAMAEKKEPEDQDQDDAM